MLSNPIHIVFYQSVIIFFLRFLFPYAFIAGQRLYQIQQGQQNFKTWAKNSSSKNILNIGVSWYIVTYQHHEILSQVFAFSLLKDFFHSFGVLIPKDLKNIHLMFGGFLFVMNVMYDKISRCLQVDFLERYLLNLSKVFSVNCCSVKIRISFDLMGKNELQTIW